MPYVLILMRVHYCYDNPAIFTLMFYDIPLKAGTKKKERNTQAMKLNCWEPLKLEIKLEHDSDVTLPENKEAWLAK